MCKSDEFINEETIKRENELRKTLQFVLVKIFETVKLNGYEYCTNSVKSENKI